MRISIGTRLVATAMLALITGCPPANPTTRIDRPHAEGWSQRQFPDAGRQQAFDAGIDALRNWFVRLETDPPAGLIRGANTEYSQKGGTERMSDAIGRPNRMRRSAVVEVEASDAGCIVRCVVMRQRLDTTDHRMVGQNEGINDVPNRTPLERDAGLNREQQEVWTDMPRDRALERDILTAIEARIHGAASGQPTSATGP